MSRRRSKCYSAQQLILGVILPLCLLSHGAQAATLEASAVAAVQQQQQGFMSVVLSDVQPLVETRYNWKVSTQANVKAIQVPVDSNTGWPEVRYKVSFSRDRDAQTVYTLSGQVAISTVDTVASGINLPAITVTTNAGRVFRMPETALNCPSLVVPAKGSLTCSFAASYAGRQPNPGTMSASVDLAGVLIPITVDSTPVNYDFSGAEVVETGAFGTAANYFEMGEGVLQPYGVYGEQPPPGLKLEDSREFAFIAVFGNVPRSKCGRQQYKGINTAELTPSSSDVNVQSPVKSSKSTIAITLTGCDGSSGFSENVPVEPTPPATWPPTAWPPAVTPVAPPVAPPAPAPIPSVPGVTFAQVGSTLCGNSVCPAGQRCFDGFNCCGEDTPICGGACCASPSVCISNKCVPLGSVPCGAAVCIPGQVCGQNNVCCSPDRVVCGAACCETGQTCVAGVCAAAGSVACGTGTVCVLGQTCVDNVAGVCCNAGETGCGGRCCPAGNTCLQGQFCAPIGSSMCGAGQICNAPQQCAGGVLCCDAGATFCGGACCPGTSTCQAGQCLVPGQVLCGATVCGIGQTCQGGTVCCDSAATFCNNACCPNGNSCVNNQCVPTGSIACGPTVCQPNFICGNPQTGLCCQSLNQFGCGQACCNSFTQVCDQYRQICAERINTACVAGQIWCPGAQQCCPVGTLCSFNQCLPRNAIGRRRLHLKGITAL